MRKACFEKKNYTYCVDARFPQDTLIDMSRKLGEGSFAVVYAGKKVVAAKDFY